MKIFNNAPPTPQTIDANKTVDRSSEKAKVSSNEAARGAKSQVPVEISDEARFRSLAREVAGQSPDVRRERVEALKKAVQSGTYHVDAAKIADKLVDEHLETEFGKNNL